MADDEQFSLCWNNFNTNLSAGFHDSLCRGDLVDVTLAAEGQLVKAHRLVLSVCSPYFRKMFTQMPANQHAFVFLKDVSHSALKDLIQFMYCGEVNVKQDALPAFISTAEALQIKGLTETGEGSSAPPHQSPAKEGPSVPSASPRSKQQTRARVQSYKVESEESSDEKVVQVQTQKRTLQRSITPQVTPVTKRAKITADPLESSDPPTVQTVHVVKQQVQQPLQSSEPEYVEMPMETINPKSEPEYVEDTSEIEAAEQEHDQDTETHELQEQDDTTYVEDESYGDIKYDESYFNENDEAKAGVSGFSESYTEGGDQSASEAQDLDCLAIFTQTMRGKDQLLYLGQPFIFEKVMRTPSGEEKKIWRCNQWWNQKCRARVYTIGNIITPLNKFHTHSDIIKRKRRMTKKDKIMLNMKFESENRYEVVLPPQPDDIDCSEFLERKKLDISDF